MDHNLDDSLNLDSAMGVDFETSGDQVVSQADISLDAGSHEATIPMEFEPIEEHPMLMDAENEQIIGYSDDQFNLRDYGLQQQDEDTGANTTVVTSEPSIPQSDSIIDIQFDPQSFISNATRVESAQPKIIAVKTSMPPRFTAIKKESVVLSMPRQVAIAPKPRAPPPRGAAPAPRTLTLAPRGLALAPRAGLVRKVSIGSVVPGAAPGKAVIAQIGKQLVMMPAGSNQKIKLVSASGGASSIQYIRAGGQDQAQLIASKNISGAGKPMLTKFIVQGAAGGDPANQPAVLTRLLGGAAPARVVTMTQKTVPIDLHNKMLLTSPSKQAVRITKKQQFVEIKSPTPKLVPTSQAGVTKKVVITATPGQNVIYKTTAPIKTTPQINKDLTVQGQRTQLHQINVPGKGIQYIRLVTSEPRLKPAPRPASTIVLTDNKGNVIQMAGEKVQSSQPPPLVISATSTINKLTAKPQQKLVRIAPVGSKPAIAATQSIGRSSQSLLAPLSPVAAPAPAAPPAPLAPASPAEPAAAAEEMDNKAALRALIAEAVRPDDQPAQELELEFQPTQSPEARERPSSAQDAEPLIVVPTYLKPHDALADDFAKENGKRFNNFEAQSFNSYQASPTPQALSESELGPGELGLRPRKACNCTKSQCLKLYCDCFANGEFCNRCNCTNCHNNLENEELRQKAIRGCLDRNPNAFRPKIGKAKSGGPDIVRRHNKGCNCKRSGCLKNYCECYEAKIACTAMCKCVGCRNVEETLDRRRRDALRDPRDPRDPRDHVFRPPALPHINFMTTEVIEAVCQCLIAAAAEPAPAAPAAPASPAAPAAPAAPDPVRDVIDEFSRCLQDIIAAAHHSPLLDESRA